MGSVIYIFADSAAFSGVDVFFERLARFLIAKRRKVFIVEKSGGVLSTRLVKICNILDVISDRPKEAGCLICNFSRIGQAVMWAKSVENMRLIVWYLQPNDIFSTYFPLSGTAAKFGGFAAVKFWISFQSWQHKKLRELIDTLNKKSGFIIMDGACNRSLNYFIGNKILIKSTIIPIQVSSFLRTVIKHKNQRHTLVLGYLGRLDIVKYSALKPLLQEIASVAKRKDIQIHLSFVGCGSMENILIKECKMLGIVLHNHGFQENEKAKDILAIEADLGIAMGTAALDLAAIGMPTIIIDPALNINTPSQILYRFVHEIEDYTLGEYRDIPLYRPAIHTLEEIVDELFNKWNELSVAGHEYVKENHGVNQVMEISTNKIDSSTVTIKNIYGLVYGLERYMNIFRKIWAKQFIVKIP